MALIVSTPAVPISLTYSLEMTSLTKMIKNLSGDVYYRASGSWINLSTGHTCHSNIVGIEVDEVSLKRI